MRMYHKLAVAVVAGGALAAAGAAPAAAAPPTADLTITYLATPDSKVVTWQLVCGPAGGTHPDPVGACDRLDSFKTDPFAPVPPGTICLPWSDSPATAQITGQWREKPVDAAFDRVDSCEMARWDNLVPVLPKIR